MLPINWNEKKFPFSLNTGFDSFFNNKDWSSSLSNAMPPVNVLESESSFDLELIAPGKTKEDFEISISDQTITIRSEEISDEENDDTNYTRKEYSYRSFTRSFSLPQHCKSEDIKASYENGVLKITIPKTETAPVVSRSIAVN